MAPAKKVKAAAPPSTVTLTEHGVSPQEVQAAVERQRTEAESTLGGTAQVKYVTTRHDTEFNDSEGHDTSAISVGIIWERSPT